MQQTISALLALQELDAEIYRLRDELRRLPEERTARRAQIDAMIARREETQRKARESRTKIKEIEDLTTIQRQRMRKVEHESTQSKTDMALLAAYQHQIRTLKRDISQAEEEGLALVSDADAVEGEAKRMQAEIEQAELVYADFAKNVERETAEAAKKLAQLEARRRERMNPQVEGETFALYERLLASRDGVALAELDSRICQQCYMEVPVNLYVRVAKGDRVVQCPSCDRIFYVRA
jgi:predicted  nucleic acid-binding Zn-ribbon protein